MINEHIAPKKIGDCESCTLTGLAITLHNRIWFCETCWKKEVEVIEANQKRAKEVEQAQEMIARAGQIDQTIEVKQDIWNANTVAAIELRQAIMKDDSIPVDQKEYRYAKMTEERMLHLRKVIFDEEQALIAKKTEMRMWHTQTVETCAKLSAKYRAEFKDLNINYPEKPVKTVKPAAEKKSKKTGSAAPMFNLAQAKELSAKYKVDVMVIRMTSIQHKVAADVAALHASNKLFKRECDCVICKKAS